MAARRGALRDRGRGLPGPEPRAPDRAARRPAVGAEPDRCCDLRKVRPLERALAGVDAWISGVRRDQSPSRAGTAKLAWDQRHERWKANPLADWTEKDVWRYIAAHDVPYNPLHDRGYASIGCTHCTKPGAGRDGRWTAGEIRVRPARQRGRRPTCRPSRACSSDTRSTSSGRRPFRRWRWEPWHGSTLVAGGWRVSAAGGRALRAAAADFGHRMFGLPAPPREAREAPRDLLPGGASASRSARSRAC